MIFSKNRIWRRWNLLMVTLQKVRSLQNDCITWYINFEMIVTNLWLAESYLVHKSINCSMVSSSIIIIKLYISTFSPSWQECFHEKDYLNHRYHAKRFLYLCIIKKYLNSSSFIRKVEWSTLQNEARKPVLVVYPGLLLCQIFIQSSALFTLKNCVNGLILFCISH